MGFVLKSRVLLGFFYMERLCFEGILMFYYCFLYLKSATPIGGLLEFLVGNLNANFLPIF